MRLQFFHSLIGITTRQRNKTMKSHLECSRKHAFSRCKIKFNDLAWSNVQTRFTFAGQSFLAKVSKEKNPHNRLWEFSWILEMTVHFFRVEFWYINSETKASFNLITSCSQRKWFQNQGAASSTVLRKWYLWQHQMKVHSLKSLIWKAPWNIS